ncbi:MAG TPA: PRC-barrel domain-containing protein [Chloroflexota bacterium]|nr:PRC-barrel domain-containing protein [Chloroflexota bacterium]
MLPLRNRAVAPTEIAVGMDVVDLDGEPVGTVTRVSRRAALLEVATGFFGQGRRVLIPVPLVRDVVQGCVFLREPKQAIEYPLDQVA